MLNFKNTNTKITLEINDNVPLDEQFKDDLKILYKKYNIGYTFFPNFKGTPISDIRIYNKGNGITFNLHKLFKEIKKNLNEQ